MRLVPDRGARRLCACAAMLVSSASVAIAQGGPRTVKPSGAEIAQKARAARLDRASSVVGQFQGKRIAFTPAVLGPRANVGAGAVIGVLENDVAGDETGLPPGKYDVYAARLSDGWHVYAAANGQIVREALAVRVQRKGQPADRRPRFRAKGWGLDVDFGGTIEDPPPVATVTIRADTTSVLVGQTRQYTIELRDATGRLLSGRSIAWSSNTPSIATTPLLAAVKGMNAGRATLVASSEGKSASLDVQVPPIQYTLSLSGASWSNGSYVLDSSVGQTSRLYTYAWAANCYVCPSFNPAEVAWSISDPSIATFSTSQNIATLVGARQGLATVRASYRGVTTTVQVTVGPAKVTSVALSPTSVTVAQGQAQQVSATVRDATGALVATPSIAWASSDPAIADVTSSGRVAGVTPGVANVTATVQGVSTSVPVRVTLPPVASVAVAPSTLGVAQDALGTLTATVKDAQGTVLTDRSIVWSSSNVGIVDVTSSGRVVGVSPGTALVTATSEGRSGSATITVEAPATAETLSFNW